MYMEFNGFMLNYENVVSFRKAPINKNGKYPIIVESLIHDSTTQGIYTELFDTQQEQDNRYDEIKAIIGYHPMPSYDSTGSFMMGR